MSTSNELKISSNTTFTIYFQHSYNRILARTTTDSVFRIPESGSPASQIPIFLAESKVKDGGCSSRWLFSVDIDGLSVILLVLWEWFCSFWLQLISKTSNVRWKADTVSRCFDFITSSRSNATEDQTKLEQQIWTKAPERRVCNIYSLSFIFVGSCFTHKLDRSKFWTISFAPCVYSSVP